MAPAHHSSFRTPPSLADIELLARHALAALPAKFRRALGDVTLRVEDLADDAVAEELGLESPWDLTGLYRGTPLPERSVSDNARTPDLVVLYRLPILSEWVETGEDLQRLVASVLIHEIGHHFGFSDADIEALERGSD
jgi:predicted Zn-dependent protease with MMP-like domain